MVHAGIGLARVCLGSAPSQGVKFSSSAGVHARTHAACRQAGGGRTLQRGILLDALQLQRRRRLVVQVLLLLRLHEDKALGAAAGQLVALPAAAAISLHSHVGLRMQRAGRPIRYAAAVGCRSGGAPSGGRRRLSGSTQPHRGGVGGLASLVRAILPGAVKSRHAISEAALRRPPALQAASGGGWQEQQRHGRWRRVATARRSAGRHHECTTHDHTGSWASPACLEAVGSVPNSAHSADALPHFAIRLAEGDHNET